MDDELHDRFLRMTKDQFAVIAVCVAFFVLMLQGYTIWNTSNLADRGAQSHAALCVYKQTLVNNDLQVQAYLASDTNGTILGLPRSLFIASQKTTEQTLKALDGLHC